MANTYTSLYYHIVFSTKNRVGFIKPEIEQRVWEYIGGIARENKMTALQVSSQKFGVNLMMRFYKPFVFNACVQRFGRFTPNF